MILADPFAVVMYMCLVFVIGVLCGYRFEKVVKNLRRRMRAWDERHGVEPKSESETELHHDADTGVTWAEKRHAIRTLRPVEDDPDPRNVRMPR